MDPLIEVLETTDAQFRAKAIERAINETIRGGQMASVDRFLLAFDFNRWNDKAVRQAILRATACMDGRSTRQKFQERLKLATSPLAG